MLCLYIDLTPPPKSILAIDFGDPKINIIDCNQYRMLRVVRMEREHGWVIVVAKVEAPDLGRETYRVLVESPIPVELPYSIRIPMPAWIRYGRHCPPPQTSPAETPDPREVQATTLGEVRQGSEAQGARGSVDVAAQHEGQWSTEDVVMELEAEEPWAPRLFQELSRQRPTQSTFPSGPTHAPQRSQAMDPAPAEAAGVPFTKRSHKFERGRPEEDRNKVGQKKRKGFNATLSQLPDAKIYPWYLEKYQLSDFSRSIPLHDCIITDLAANQVEPDSGLWEACAGPFLVFPPQVLEGPDRGRPHAAEHPVLPVRDSLAWMATLQTRVIAATGQQTGKKLCCSTATKRG